MHLIGYEIQDMFKQYKVPAKDRKALAEMVAAESVGVMLPVPTSKLKNPNSHFMANHKVEVMDRLGKLVEEVVIDLDRTYDLVYRVWLMRYNLVHRPNDVRTGRLLAAAISGNTKMFPEKYESMVTNYPDAFIHRKVLENEGDLNFGEEEV